jgi:chromosome segregation ATPase
MLLESRSPIAALICGLALTYVIALPSAEARGKKKGGKRGPKPIKLSTEGLKEDVARAQAGLAHATDRGVAAQSRLGASHARAQNARQALEAARLDAEEATEQLKRIEARVVDSQGPDSKYADLLKDFTEAEQHYQKIRERVYESPEYLAKYREAASSSKRASLLPKIRKEAEEKEPEYRKAATQLVVKRTMYEQHRSTLLQQNPDWLAASKAALQARRRQAEAQEHYKSAMVSKGITASNLSKAARDATAAHRAIEKGRDAIKQVEAYNKKVDTVRKRQSSSRRRR